MNNKRTKPSAISDAPKKRWSTKKIYKKIFCTQLLLIVTLALFLGVSGTLINIHFEVLNRDKNLQNIAEAIANSPLIDSKINNPSDPVTTASVNEYLDSLKLSLKNIDAISFVRADNLRLYHSNHDLIGTYYDGTVPKFEKDSKEYHTANEIGPSGSQRRAYAAVYDSNGNYTGFVMAIMLLENIRYETLQTLLIFMLITIAAILIELLISAELSKSIKKSLNGHEPNVFSAMFKIRDNILESLNEGIVAVDKDGIIQFANKSAADMLGAESSEDLCGTPMSTHCNDTFVKDVIANANKKFNIREKSIENSDVLIDCLPIKEYDKTIGAAAILHNREEYTKLLEDLTGTRYLVDSMRANNHDFTNKLHVILGLIQMEMYSDAVNYIENISIVQRETVGKITSVINDPSVAALLIGKAARASELNIKFILKENTVYTKNDMFIPSELLITIIGNLIDNAYDAMNVNYGNSDKKKELCFGIFSKPGEVVITVDDTGTGICEGNLSRIFDNGFSTKGCDRGTGLFKVKELVESSGGKIEVESVENVGTSFTVSFTDAKQTQNL